MVVVAEEWGAHVRLRSNSCVPTVVRVVEDGEYVGKDDDNGEGRVVESEERFYLFFVFFVINEYQLIRNFF